MKLVLLLVFACALFVSVSFAHAQGTGGKNLRGLRSANLAIENLSNAAAQCGIDKPLLETSLRFILQQSRLRLVSDAHVYIYLRVTVVPSCAADITLKVDAPVTISYNKESTLAGIWEAGLTLTSPRSEAARDTANAVERLAKQLVADWSAVNQ